MLRRIDGPSLLRYVAEQRWFGARTRAARGARITDVIRVPWGVRGAAFVRVAVELDGGETVGYLLPLAVVAGEPSDNAASLVAVRAPNESGALIDATTDDAFREALGAALSTPQRLGDDTALVTMPVEAPLEVPTTPSRVVSAEQSNTSIVYGEAAILKLVRRLEPGEHPEVEIARFLTTRVGFPNTPALLAELRFERSGASIAAGMMSRYVPGTTDGWSWALSTLDELLAGRFGAHIQGSETQDLVRLGGVTGALHDALTSRPQDPGFSVRQATRGDVATWAAATRRAADRALVLLESRAKNFRGKIGAMAAALAKRRSEALAIIDDLARKAEDASDLGLISRHHGDLHLGQVLRTTDGDWMIIDFEGEPARSLEARRAPHSPLRDVAGMLRSFSYAAATASARLGEPGTNMAAETLASRWERAACDAFLAGYDSPAGAELVPLFEAEKVFYELEYELNNRPEWVWIPLRGIAKLF